MYQLSTPSFRFVVFLIEEVRFKNSNSQQNQTQTTCYADTYEVNSDGSITFYQIGLHSGKRVKVPVLTYPHGKWTGIVLADDNNQFPVFNGSASFNSVSSSSQTPFGGSSNSNNSYKSHDKQNESKLNEDLTQEDDIDNKNDSTSQPAAPIEKSEDELDSVMGMFDDGNSSSISQGHGQQQGNNQNNWARGNSQSYNTSNTNPHVHIPNKGIPGISQNMNPNEFKKAKNEFLETQVKDYVKYNPTFNLEEVVASANKEARTKNLGKFSDTDVIWVASNLIRDKSVQTRKFVEPVIQKNLSHILPDIMRRQWSGKMGPILQVLEEREETKNVTAIDLAVWMVQNNFE